MVHTSDDVRAPRLHKFYMRNVFTCDIDGRPIWCSSVWIGSLTELTTAVKREAVFGRWITFVFGIPALRESSRVGDIVSETSQKGFRSIEGRSSAVNALAGPRGGAFLRGYGQ